MIKKALLLLLLASPSYAAQAVKYVQISTGALQAGTTAGFNVSSGTVGTFYASSATVSTMNITGLLNLSGIVGSSGTFVVSQGQNKPPLWQRNGLVLQIVSSTMTSLTQQTTTSASYSSTTLNVNITPLSSTSKIIVFSAQSFGASGVAGTVCTARTTRDTTDINKPGDFYAFVDDSATESDSIASLLAVDSPGDTSPHTYKTRFARSAGTGTCVVNSTIGSVGGNGGFMIIVEVSQ